jgi:hypothetical protein
MIISPPVIEAMFADSLLLPGAPSGFTGIPQEPPGGPGGIRNGRPLLRTMAEPPRGAGMAHHKQRICEGIYRRRSGGGHEQAAGGQGLAFG